MKTTVFVVTTCIPERGEKPCLPSVFVSEAEADSYADEMLRIEWEANGPSDDDTGERLPYPGDWQEANDAIAAEFDDGSWGEWQITSHLIEIGTPGELLASLKEIAQTPRHGEPCPEAPNHEQSWDDEGGRYAIDRLHEIIDAARAAVALVEGLAHG